MHFADAPDQARVRQFVTDAAGEKLAKGIAFDIVEAKDWVKATLEDLVPVQAGRFVVHGQHDRARLAPNKLGIEIEAALAFGTGHHGTTRGCLLLLDHVLKAWRPRRVLDLGTGTGVLAIAAAKALHAKILASDIDPVSVTVARENARLNMSGHLVQAIPATGFSAPQFAHSRPVRPGAGKYPRQSVAAIGNADGAASGTIGAGYSVGTADAAGGFGNRGLSGARTGPGATPAHRWLEQPAAALRKMTAGGRECGECTLCCKVMAIEELAKPASSWCPHCKPGRGCLIYANRPAECRAFSCLWLINDLLDQHWKPSKSKLVLTTSEDGIEVRCDPGFPDAWRKEPFRSEIHQWAVSGEAHDITVIVIIGERMILIASDREFDLGIVQPDERIVRELEGTRVVNARLEKVSDLEPENERRRI